MASLNKVTLIGNLGKDPELRYTKSQTPFARFSLATTEEYTSNGEKQRKTQWHNLVVWGKQAEIAERYLHKGKQIYVEGRIEYREYDSEGGKRTICEIKVDRFLMLGQTPSGQGGAARGSDPSAKYGPPAGQNEPDGYGGQDEFDDDQIPF